jgi:hypothetical protein
MQALAQMPEHGTTTAAAALPDAVWARIAACADLNSRRALRATCSALRRLADAGCASLELPPGVVWPAGDYDAAAAAMRALAARAGAFGVLRRLHLRGARDDCVAPLADLLAVASG